MPTPSLLIVPARFKSGKLYSQLPTSGAGDFTVTRATAATRVNASGFIDSVASGIPRLDYFASDGTVGCPALLVEPSGSNLAINSQTWDASNNWELSEVSGRVTVATATSGTLAPDGTSTANAITPTSGNITHYLYSNATGTISYVSGTVYTLSAFFKKGLGASGRYVQIAGRGSIRFVGDPYANFDLELGTTLTVSGSVADSNRVSRIQNYGNGWYRCSLTATCRVTAVSTVGVLAALLTADTNARLGAAFAGNTSDYIFGWGAQFETGSVATSYIPTTTGSVTRNADVISVSGAVSGSIGQQSGTIYCEFQFNTPTRQNAGVLSVESTNNQNRILLWHNSTNNALAVQLRANNSNVFNTSIGTLTNGQFYKIAIGYSSENTKVYLNGNLTAVITNTSAYTMAAALSRICLGNYEDSAALATFSRIRSFALYPERLSDDQMIALTTL